MTTEQFKILTATDIESMSDREILVLLVWRVSQLEDQITSRSMHLWNLLGGAALVVLTFVLTKY